MSKSITGRGAWNAANAKLANEPFSADKLFPKEVTISAAELEALREIARLATVIRTRHPGLLAVMWENDAEGSRKLPYMREKFDAAFAALAQKGTTK